MTMFNARQLINKDKSPQPTPKTDLYGRKVMYVWWDHQDIIHLEFIKCNEILDAHLYV